MKIEGNKTSSVPMGLVKKSERITEKYKAQTYIRQILKKV